MKIIISALVIIALLSQAVSLYQANRDTYKDQGFFWWITLVSMLLAGLLFFNL